MSNHLRPILGYPRQLRHPNFKKQILLLIFLTTIAITSQVVAQAPPVISPNDDFQEIVRKMEEYYQDEDKGPGTGYKQFKRWESYHAKRLSPDGKIQNVEQINFNEFYFYEENRNGRSTNNRSLNVVGGDWESVGPTRIESPNTNRSIGIGRINEIVVDPANSNIIYVGTPAGGLWRSTTGGNSWTALTDGIPRIGISGIAIDPTSPTNNRTIYILTGDGNGRRRGVGVLKSTDNGETWNSTSLTGALVGLPYKITIHPSNPQILYVASHGGIFKTINGGFDWERTVRGQFFDIEFRPFNPDIIYASTRNNIYRSSNAGDTWSESNITLLSNNSRSRIELAVTSAQPGYVYAVNGKSFSSFSSSRPGFFNGVFRSTDSGLNFTVRSTRPNILGRDPNGNDDASQANYDLAIAVSPTNAEEVHVGGINAWRSFNGGSNWERTTDNQERRAGSGDYTHADIHHLSYIGNTIYCGTDGGIYKSNNRGSDWTNLSDGLQITQIYNIGTGRFPSSGAEGISVSYGSQDNGLACHGCLIENSSERWQTGDGFESYLDHRVVGSVLQSYVLGATQNGRLWFYQENLFLGLGIRFNDLDEVTPAGAESGSFQTAFDALYLTSSNATRVAHVMAEVFVQDFSVRPEPENWTNISNGRLNISTSLNTEIAISPSNPNTIYVSSSRRIYSTSNLGSSWTQSNPPSGTINYIAVHPSNPNTAYITGFGDVLMTTDRGQSWSDISGSLPNISINCIVHDRSDKNGLYVGTDVGVFFRNDDMNDWIPFYHNLPNVQVDELEISTFDNLLYAGTFGRGLWKTELFGRECPQNLTVRENQDGFKFHTANNIVSSSLIEPLANVSFVAGNRVVLENGFNTDSNTRFIARIDEDVCSDGILGRGASQKRGRFAGPLLRDALPETNTSLSTELSTTEMVIFPNPSRSTFYYQYQLEKESEVQMIIYDLNGRKVYSKDMGIKFSGKQVDKIADGNLSPGTYLVEIITNEKKMHSKLIIE